MALLEPGALPQEIFAGRWAEPLGNFFTFIVPILRGLERAGQRDGRSSTPAWSALTIVAAVVLLWLSRRFFQHALRSYRSASS